MKTITVSFIIMLLVSATAHAQKSLFKMYRFECSELYNIDLKKPKGFKVTNKVTPFKVNEKKAIGVFYRMTLESKNKDCLILYPFFYRDDDQSFLGKNMFYGEIKAALNLNPNNEIQELDSAKYIQMVAKDNMEGYFNADTVLIFKVPLLKPYKETYSQCIGINVIKVGHPFAMMKILLTEDGKKKEEEYIQILLKSIRYGDVMPVVSKQIREKVRKKMNLRFFFYNRKNYLYL